MKFLRDILLLF